MHAYYQDGLKYSLKMKSNGVGAACGYRFSIGEATPVEVGARPADGVLDRVGQDARYQHGEQDTCA
jgi:hypothetical protein